MTRKPLRRIALVLSSVASALVVTAALHGVTHEERASAQDPITLKIATIAPDGTPWEKQLRSLKTHLEKASGGRFRVKVFMGGSLGGEKALVRRTSQGTIQVFGGSTAALASVVTELDVIESPYLFESYTQADGILDNVVRQRAAPLLTKRGFEFGLWAENGWRSMFTKERRIQAPGDMAGLRMRSQESPVHLAMYRALGANPVPIDATNVLTSLQTGVVDGFDNTMLFAFATSWYQGVHHLALTQHIYQPGIVAYSKRWFDGLPADLQQVLRELPPALTTDGRRQVRQMDPILQRNLAKAGVTITELSAEQRAAFARATAQVADRIAKTPDSRALLRAIRDARQQYH